MSLISLPNAWAQLACVQGMIRIPTLEKVREEKAEYCYDLSNWTLISKGCEEKTKCDLEAVFNSKTSRLKRGFPERGTPGSALCRQIGGRAQVILFEAGGSFQKLNRCLMTSDGSFVDLGTLDRWMGP